MNVAIAIPNHNQHDTVYKTIELLDCQTQKPSHIYVLSDGIPFTYDTAVFREIHPNVVCINNDPKRGGRCNNRNSVVPKFLAEGGDDAIVFIDGDCYPKTNTFMEEYAGLLANKDLVFCMREHTSVENIIKPASDLLTANMDRLWSGEELDYEDLRVTSGAVKAWNESKYFSERVDLMLTGMIGWSCNFGITKHGLERLVSFTNSVYGSDNELFDSKAFSNGWGYEDVAMGLDAMYAGLSIGVSHNPTVCHISHERSDGLFDHIKGRHMIMERYRELQYKLERFSSKIAIGFMSVTLFIIGIVAGRLI